MSWKINFFPQVRAVPPMAWKVFFYKSPRVGCWSVCRKNEILEAFEPRMADQTGEVSTVYRTHDWEVSTNVGVHPFFRPRKPAYSLLQGQHAKNNTSAWKSCCIFQCRFWEKQNWLKQIQNRRHHGWNNCTRLSLFAVNVFSLRSLSMLRMDSHWKLTCSRTKQANAAKTKLMPQKPNKPTRSQPMNTTKTI